MVTSSILQLSLVSEREWASLFSRVDRMQGTVRRKARHLSFTVKGRLQNPPPELRRRVSDWSESSEDDSDLVDVAEAVARIFETDKVKVQ
jgi:hypothetical protein